MDTGMAPKSSLGVVCTLYCAFLLFLTSCEGVQMNLQNYQSLITLIHNYYRAHENAADMKELTWDSYLQQRAESWSDTCYWGHQKRGLGENLAYFWTTGPGMETMDIILRSSMNWWKEVHEWTWSTRCGAACHYTQMIWAKTERIGCALKRCPTFKLENGDILNNAYYFVCFYDPPGNYIGQYPYTQGQPCSLCDPGEGCKAGLCSKIPVTTTTPDPPSIATGQPDIGGLWQPAQPNNNTIERFSISPYQSNNYQEPPINSGYPADASYSNPVASSNPATDTIINTAPVENGYSPDSGAYSQQIGSSYTADSSQRNSPDTGLLGDSLLVGNSPSNPSTSNSGPSNTYPNPNNNNPRPPDNNYPVEQGMGFPLDNNYDSIFSDPVANSYPVDPPPADNYPTDPPPADNYPVDRPPASNYPADPAASNYPVDPAPNEYPGDSANNNNYPLDQQPPLNSASRINNYPSQHTETTRPQMSHPPASRNYPSSSNDYIPRQSPQPAPPPPLQSGYNPSTNTGSITPEQRNYRGVPRRSPSPNYQLPDRTGVSRNRYPNQSNLPPASSQYQTEATRNPPAGSRRNYPPPAPHPSNTRYPPERSNYPPGYRSSALTNSQPYPSNHPRQPNSYPSSQRSSYPSENYSQDRRRYPPPPPPPQQSRTFYPPPPAASVASAYPPSTQPRPQGSQYPLPQPPPSPRYPSKASNYPPPQGNHISSNRYPEPATNNNYQPARSEYPRHQAADTVSTSRLNPASYPASGSGAQGLQSPTSNTRQQPSNTQQAMSPLLDPFMDAALEAVSSLF